MDAVAPEQVPREKHIGNEGRRKEGQELADGDPFVGCDGVTTVPELRRVFLDNGLKSGLSSGQGNGEGKTGVGGGNARRDTFGTALPKVEDTLRKRHFEVAGRLQGETEGGKSKPQTTIDLYKFLFP